MVEGVIIDELTERGIKLKLEFQYVTCTNEEKSNRASNERITELNTCRCYSKDMKDTLLRSGGGENSAECSGYIGKLKTERILILIFPLLLKI